jgi:hypothetical protein
VKYIPAVSVKFIKRKVVIMRRVALIFVTAILASAAMGQVNVGGPADVQDPNYPLRVRLLTRNTSHGPYGYRTWGRADLFSPQEQAFDFETTCDEVIMVTRGDERYSARWKKQDKELEMLVSKMGTGKADKCTVKADMHQFVYEYERGTSGAVITKPLAP